MKNFSLLQFKSIIFVAISISVLFAAQWILPTPQDIHTFYVWMLMGFERGILHIYQWSPAEVLAQYQEFSVNYPPLILFLYPFAWLFHQVHLWPDWPSPFAILFFRLPLLLGHFAICLTLLKKRVDLSNRSQILIWLFLFLLNPAFLIAGPIWGQLNFLLWGFMALSFVYWEERQVATSAFFAVLGALTKPQFMMFIPLIGIFLVATRDFQKSAKWIGYFLGILIGLISPWWFTSGWDCLRSGYIRVSDNQYSLADIGYGFWWTLRNALQVDLQQVRLGGWGAQSLAIWIPNAVIGLLGATRFLRGLMDWEEFSAFSLLLLFCFLPGMNAQCLVFGTAFVCLVALKRPNQLIWAVSISLIQIYQLAYNAIWTPRTRLYLAIPTEVAQSLGALCFLLLVGFAVHFASSHSSKRII